MTKTHWKEILEELKKFRDTNKFRTQIYYETFDENLIPIDKINTNELYIRFPGRKYLTHNDVLDVTPSELRKCFLVTMCAFDIEKVNFK